MAPAIPVGLVAPLPPQVGGVATVAGWLLDHETDLECSYVPFDLHRPAGSETGGRIRASTLTAQARLLARFLRWAPTAPPLVHYCVACTTTGLARDLAYVAVLRLRRRRVVAHVHALAEGSSVWRLGMRALARMTAERVVNSPHAVAELERLGISSRHVTNPLRLRPRRVQGEGARLRLLFVGMYGKLKGTPELIEALASARAGGVDATLRLVGLEGHRGEERRLRQRVSRLELDCAVEFAGLVSSDRIGEHYAAADVICLPSHREGLPMVLLEGMAFGLPALATPVGGIPQLVEDRVTGLLVPPGDVEHLADAIAELARDPEGRKRMGSAAADRVRSIADPDHVLASWRTLYREYAA
jgi:glycosyltransferase involved in cell wall biosynthesis